MKKNKLKRKILIIFAILVLLLSYPSYLTIRLVTNNYSLKSSYKIIVNGCADFAIKNKYSKTFDEAITDSHFKKDYKSKYIKIDYYNNKDFINTINTLLSKQYTTNQINNINKRIKYEDVLTLTKKDIVKDIDKYLEYEHFSFKNLDRYITYYQKSNDYKITITYVNIGLDQEPYKNAVDVKEFNTLMIVNKYNKLDETYEPPDIGQIANKYSYEKQYLNKLAKEAFEKMCDDALKEGYYLIANSSYRSYKSQKELYDYYFKNYGSSYTQKYVSIPGYSEHQTGLALDIGSKKVSIFKNSREYTWLKNNAYKYGFIQRYPEGKENITGYNTEAWHYRYVGLDAAKYIWENSITFEEYYAIYLYK